MQAAGLDDHESAVRIRQWQERQKDFLQQTGLKRQAEREQVRTEAIKAKQLPDVKRQAPLRKEVAEGLAKEFGGKPSDWQHAKGFGELTEDGMESRPAEVHWFQAKGVGKVKFKVKRWLDEG